jgi:CDP-paratose 2-epimerase
VEQNLRWLNELHGKMVEFVKGDVRDQELLRRCASDVNAIFHLAAQTAVTTSIENPREDFEVNALGTLNVLEAARLSETNPVVIFTSTNKVYGDLDELEIVELETRYELGGEHANGIDESLPLRPSTPYAVSKAMADIYTSDYHRIYGLRTIVFRLSCIYGERQFGIEAQGWIDFMMRRAVRGLPIRIYGDGKQVRDLLHISDLTLAFEAAMQAIARTKGQAYNLGGGKQNISILELLSVLKEFGLEVRYEFADWRPADQKVFYCNLRKAMRDFGFEPRVGKEEGLRRQLAWVRKTVRLSA